MAKNGNEDKAEEEGEALTGSRSANEVMEFVLQASRNIYGNYFMRNFSLSISPANPNVLISYLPFPLWLPPDSKEMVLV